uniref:Uncharacterized protein n=2 Tax=Bos TaxID=9903 RepID=A0A4W2DPE9_BOBOX
MNCEYFLAVRKVLNQTSLCLMFCSCLFILSVMVLIIHHLLFSFIDFLQKIKSQKCTLTKVIQPLPHPFVCLFDSVR